MSGTHGDDHGNTPAAWTAVAIIIVGFTIGGIGVILASIPTFIAGGVVVVLGAVAGKVMQMMGLGKQPEAAADEPAGA